MDADFDISCPGCKHTFKKAASTMKPGNTCTCPNCKQTIEFSGGDVSQIMKDLGDSFDDLGDAFDNFGK